MRFVFYGDEPENAEKKRRLAEFMRGFVSGSDRSMYILKSEKTVAEISVIDFGRAVVYRINKDGVTITQAATNV